MADKIEVHFTSGGKPLRAVVTPTARFRGVLILAEKEGVGAMTISTFLQNNPGVSFVSGKTKLPELPEGVTVKGKTDDTDVQLSKSDDGPGVCYWVGNELICW